MTVSSSTDRESFAGNGVTQHFDLPFRFFNDSEIVAQLIEDATGATTLLSLGIDYTLEGAGLPEVDGNALSAIDMIVAPASGYTLFVQRVLPLSQPTDIVNQGRFFPDIHENVFDRLTMQIQQIVGDSSRTLRTPALDAPPAILPNAIARASKVLAFDVNGDPVASNLTLAQIETQVTDSAANAELARQWAENPEDDPVVPGEFSSLHWAAKAAQQALAASGFADDASDSADAAAISETNAAASAAAAAATLANALLKTGGTMSGALNEAPLVTLASAATVDIGAAAANTINISGSVAITSLGTIAAGARRTLIFQGAPTITYNAVSLILPGAANIVAAAGDIAEFVSLGSGNWVCINYERFNKRYLSTPQTITSGGLLTLNHNLSAEPSRVWLELHCVGAEFGFAVGAHIQIDNIQLFVSGTTVNRGVNIQKTSTQLLVRFGNTVSAFHTLDSTGAATSLTNANWRAVLGAEL